MIWVGFVVVTLVWLGACWLCYDTGAALWFLETFERLTRTEEDHHE